MDDGLAAGLPMLLRLLAQLPSLFFFSGTSPPVSALGRPTIHLTPPHFTSSLPIPSPPLTSTSRHSTPEHEHDEARDCDHQEMHEWTTLTDHSSSRCCCLCVMRAETYLHTRFQHSVLAHPLVHMVRSDSTGCRKGVSSHLLLALRCESCLRCSFCSLSVIFLAVCHCDSEAECSRELLQEPELRETAPHLTHGAEVGGPQILLRRRVQSRTASKERGGGCTATPATGGTCCCCRGDLSSTSDRPQARASCHRRWRERPPGGSSSSRPFAPGSCSLFGRFCCCHCSFCPPSRSRHDRDRSLASIRPARICDTRELIAFNRWISVAKSSNLICSHLSNSSHALRMHMHMRMHRYLAALRSNSKTVLVGPMYDQNQRGDGSECSEKSPGTILAVVSGD